MVRPSLVISGLFWLFFLLPLEFVAQQGPEKNAIANSFEKAWDSGNQVLARRLLLRMHRKSPEQLFHFVDEAEELLGVAGQDSSKRASLPALESDLMAEAYRQRVVAGGDDASDWARKHCFFLQQYPDRYPRELENALGNLLRTSRHEMPDFLLREFLERTLVDSLNNPERLVLQWERWLLARDVLEEKAILFPELARQTELLRDEYASRFEVLVPACEALDGEYRKLFINDQLEIGSYRAFLAMAKVAGCGDGFFVDDAVKKARSLSPVGAFARDLGDRAKSAEDFQLAREYWLRSLSGRKDPRLRSSDLLEIADLEARMMHFQSARDHIEEAAEIHPTWGVPWLHLADLYLLGSSACEIDPFEKQSVNWLAIELCVRAGNVNPALEPEVNRRIFEYRRNCPAREEILFRGLREGDTVPLGCWMQEATTVKFF